MKKVARPAKKESSERAQDVSPSELRRETLNAERVRSVVNAGLSTLALGCYVRLWAESENNTDLLRVVTPDELERAFGLTREQGLECAEELMAHDLVSIIYTRLSTI